jgi:hypothetical protein
MLGQAKPTYRRLSFYAQSVERGTDVLALFYHCLSRLARATNRCRLRFDMIPQGYASLPPGSHAGPNVDACP